MWTNQRTQQGDTLASLSRAYGVPVEKILAANSIRTSKEHTDRYLSARAQECMIPGNLPRKTLSKLVLEHDIQRWVHSVGGECIPLRVGARADMLRLMSCVPGEFCHFSAESVINLPQRARRMLQGLGEASMLDLLNQLNALKDKARKAVAVVDDARSILSDDDEFDAWRTGFLHNVDNMIAQASRPDEKGIPVFVRFPNKIKLIEEFIADAKNQASGFVSAGLFDNAMSNLRSSIANILASAAAFVSAEPAPAAPPAKTPAPPAPGKKDTSALAPVRAGAATLKRGTKSNAVKELQTLLRAVGVSEIVVDGVFGPQTEGAVKEFQRFRNLPVDGVLNAATLRDLDAVVAAGGKIRSGKAAGRKAAPRKTEPKAAPAAVPPPAAPVAVSTSGNKTAVYVAATVAVVLVAAAAMKARRRAA